METEIKLTLPDGDIFSDPRVASYAAGDVSSVNMRTVYYDTRDHCLSKRRHTLRLRSEGGRSVCCLKLPSRGGVKILRERPEYEADAETLELGIEALARMGAPVERLDYVSVGGAVFVRKSVLLRISRDTLCELSADVGEFGNGVKIRELELELKKGNPCELLDLADYFMRKYSLKQVEESKHERAVKN